MKTMDNMMELEAMKAQLARDILNVDSMELVKKMRKYLMREVGKEKKMSEEKISDDPYFDNPENVKDILEALEEVKRGECKLLTHEEQKRLFCL